VAEIPQPSGIAGRASAEHADTLDAMAFAARARSWFGRVPLTGGGGGGSANPASSEAVDV
jgi:hypothetical protein